MADNGAGIPAAEVELAFARHATSKLASADDLNRVTTLGFRGEALASIASVSRVALITRAAAEPVGLQVRVEAGAMTQRTPIGAPQGTVISVENLFFNVPPGLSSSSPKAPSAARSRPWWRVMPWPIPTLAST